MSEIWMANLANYLYECYDEWTKDQNYMSAINSKNNSVTRFFMNNTNWTNKEINCYAMAALLYLRASLTNDF